MAWSRFQNLRSKLSQALNDLARVPSASQPHPGQSLPSLPWIWTPTHSLLMMLPTQCPLRNTLPAPPYLLGFFLLQASLTNLSPKRQVSNPSAVPWIFWAPFSQASSLSSLAVPGMGWTHGRQLV